jgi:serine/threonine-protein kinase RsbW
VTTLKREISVTNATGNLARVRDFLTEAARNFGVRHEDENRIILAVDEAVSNIMEHAYENTLEGTIQVAVDIEMNRFTVTIHDKGKRFDPSGISDPDLEEHIRGGKKRGLGLFLMRQIMDEVDFHYKAGGENVLTLVKYLD